MENLARFIAWAAVICKDYGPILIALNAILSLMCKIRSLIKGRKSTREQDRD